LDGSSSIFHETAGIIHTHLRALTSFVTHSLQKFLGSCGSSSHITWFYVPAAFNLWARRNSYEFDPKVSSLYKGRTVQASETKFMT